MSAPDVTSTSTEPVFRVRCASWRDFAEQFADDIASGGLYLDSPAAPPMLSTVEIILLLPEATEISLRARVVQILNADQARQLGKQPGMGLELLDMDNDRRRQIVQLVEFARWQGASDDPKSSFARTLLELSPSLPPAEVVYRLSLIPSPPARSDSRPLTPAPQRPSATANAPADASVQPAARSTAVPKRSVTPASAQPAAADSRAPEDSRRSSRAPAANDKRPASASLRALRAAAESQKSLRAAAAPVTESRSPSDSQKALRSPAESQKSLRAPAAPVAETRSPAESQKSLRAPAESQTSVTPATSANSENAPPPQAKPTDQQKLKLVLTNFAHKQYEAALRCTREMLEDNPGDTQALRWQALCNARLALARNEPTLACSHYQRVLQYDPEHRESRDFIRTHQRDKRLSSLPFGRYFTSKKK